MHHAPPRSITDFRKSTAREEEKQCFSRSLFGGSQLFSDETLENEKTTLFFAENGFSKSAISARERQGLEALRNRLGSRRLFTFSCIRGARRNMKSPIS